MVTRRQLLDAGLNAATIEYQLRTGRLHRVHRNVYAVGHRPPSPLARAMAAVLACGPGAVLSHRSAAALWEIAARHDGPVDVTARTNREHPGVRVHRSRTLHPEDVTTHFGIRVTTPARTLLDIAETTDDRTLMRAVNDARIKWRVTRHDLAALLARSPGRRAAKRLRPFVHHATGPTRSDLEDAFLAFVDRFELPRPEVNQAIAGHEVDIVWREHRLVVELDSREFHDGDEPFETDRDRDADLLAAGFPVVRVTWRRLVAAPEREASRLLVLLEARAPSSAPPAPSESRRSRRTRRRSRGS
jgi:very-short-patch-repair endonuclease